MQAVAWWTTIAMLLAATLTDLWKRRIPNWLTLPFLAGGLVVSAAGWGMPGLSRSAAGIALAVAALIVPCCLRGTGWGDLKLCAALGAWIGAQQMLYALLATAMAGGFLALAYLAVRGSVKTSARMTLDDPAAQKIPYAPAIALGTLFSFFMV
jgi:prepilin peptidase CpaA